EEGREEGREEGKRERELEMARSLLLQGVDIDIIISTTQLSKEEIEKIQNS
ncbi:MAG TPA: ISNCY family transposase, partial [Holosporales bacterium]|nr:ISNCY family transposase [Holosporales bacterium]HCE96577.1 ISNCY family transposase [Holosporales bacterium]